MKLLGAIAALLIGATPALAQTKDAPWTGLYMGLHGGYGWGNLDGKLTYNDGSGPLYSIWDQPDNTLSFGSGFGGIQVGFNWQLGALVIGIEGDAAATALNESDKFTTKDGLYDWNISVRVKGMETVRGRVGVAMGSVLVYATGGFAMAHTEGKLKVMSRDGFNPAENTAIGESRDAHYGAVFGGGAEVMISQHVTLGIQYLHADFGSGDYHLKGTAYPGKPPCAPNPPAANCSFPHVTDSFPGDLTIQTLRGSVNIKF